MIESSDEFVCLRKSSDPAEYLRAAEESAPLHVWLDVLKVFPDMKVWVAHNKTVPLDILRILAIDSDRDVRSAVAEKRKLDADLFQQLGSDSDEVVRQRVAYNKKTPDDLLVRLAEDACELVRDAAKARLKRGR